MTDTFIKDFSANFDDSCYPDGFLRHYELMECFSHNEMGETLLVKDRLTGKHHVAKCYSNKSLFSHTNESDLLKKLHHCGLPAYISEYENEEIRCIVREYAPGESLAEMAREKPFTTQQSITIIIQLCEILMYLHRQTPAIIHRDIKPQNIIVDGQGKITLIDFGISRVYDETAQEDTLSLGTRHYAAPEQYGFSQTDCRSDIFSLGVLLCWLLTGREDVQQAKKDIPNPRLVKIIERCTAFAPKERYKNVTQVRDVLTGRTARRHIFSFLLAVLVVVVGGFLFTNFFSQQIQGAAEIPFKEPLIEQAVRLTLGKSDTEKISEQELLSINELFIFGDKAAASEEVFTQYARSFMNNDGTVSRGNIDVLDDLPKLKNLRRIFLVDQQITDLTPLVKLIYLEYVDLRHNPITDISPLSQLPSLSSLIIFDTRVTDVTALRTCPHLSMLDAGYTLIRSMAAFEGLTSLQTLVMRKAPLQSLEQIKNLPLLEQVYLSETQLLDLSPLLDLPRLESVEVDESMRTAAEAIAAKARFKIVYQ